MVHTPVHIAVIIVNFNSSARTLTCLQAVYAMPDRPGRIVVVDNASTVREREILWKNWERLCESLSLPLPVPAENFTGGQGNIWLSMSHNGGYAAGNNAALRLMLRTTAEDDCRAFWLLNNDTEPQAGALTALCDRLDSGCGMAGSSLVYMDRPGVVQAAAGGAYIPLIGMTRLLLGEHALYDVLTTKKERVEAALSYVSGASLLWSRQCCSAIGLLPEEYFLYYEDLALGILARRSGFRIGWARESIVYHVSGASTGAGSSRSLAMDYLALRNRYYLLRVFYPWAVPTALLIFFVVLLRRALRGQADRIPLLCAAVWHGLCGHMGEVFGAVKEASNLWRNR